MKNHRVSFAGRDQYRLLTSQGEISARLSGAFRYSNTQLPVVGDFVEAMDGLIRAILPRRTVFSRRAPGRAQVEQVIAANVDTAFVVCGLDGDYNPRRIERYLTLVRESGADAVLVFNKADLREPPPGDFGVPVIATSTLQPDGVTPLVSLVAPGQTVVLLGSSGAGKSSIANCLLGRHAQDTQQVRLHDSRGKHTTTARELFVLPCGACLIDTPGLRELQLWASHSSVDETFTEIRDLATGCRFRDCSHAGEPGCAVRRALDAGDIDYDRWSSFQKLNDEVTRLDKKQLRKIHYNARKYRPKEW